MLGIAGITPATVSSTAYASPSHPPVRVLYDKVFTGPLSTGFLYPSRTFTVTSLYAGWRIYWSFNCQPYRATVYRLPPGWGFNVDQDSPPGSFIGSSIVDRFNVANYWRASGVRAYRGHGTYQLRVNWDCPYNLKVTTGI